jgi:4-hydroxy-3-methylbut-2-en-1-yl diphosphate reductase
MTSSGSLGAGANLLVCTALGIEARAVRKGWARSRPGGAPPAVAVVGMRAPRLDRVREHDGPVLLLGFGGGLATGQQPGDVVVATKVRDENGTIALPSADKALETLQRAGIAASAGVLWFSDRIVRGGERTKLGGSALAVDMESARVARACDERRLVVVRIIVDTPSKGLIKASVFGGRRAKRALRQVAAAFAADEPPAGNEWITSGTVQVAAHSTRIAGSTSTAGTGKEG